MTSSFPIAAPYSPACRLENQHIYHFFSIGSIVGNGIDPLFVWT